MTANTPAQEVDEGAHTSSQDEQVVIEACWAPQDPRDRLYDETATKAERTMSLIRIIAAFHPVLNFFLLLSDAVRKIPLVWRLILGAGLIGAVMWLILRP
ncbi:hypothetical protein [Kordiimonas sp.]|uniref:hypothetical protein n=1 Tax=Kordiimonas sp. TaxID=1970157 RepID=UPI003A8CBF08